jgi:hypothetical protein
MGTGEDTRSPYRAAERAKRVAKRAIHGAAVHAQRLQGPFGRPRLVVFPSNQPWDPASRLRAWLIAPELRRLGWRVVVVPEPLSLEQRRHLLLLERPDVVLLQQTRHPLNDPSLYAPYPCVLDADDADCLDPRHRGRIARCAAAAAAVVGGSQFVAGELGQHNDDASVIWTGTPLPPRPPPVPPRKRAPIVAWAHSCPFLYPMEAALVREVMMRVAERTRLELWLFGTEPGPEADRYFAPIRARGVTCVAIPPMPYDAYLAKVAQVAVGLQPVCLDNAFSRGKSFGKVLAYLAGQVAVVATDGVDHPLFFRHGETALLAGNIDAWVEGVRSLVVDREMRHRLALGAYVDFLGRLTTEAFARRLDEVLRRAAGRTPAVGRAPWS